MTTYDIVVILRYLDQNVHNYKEYSIRIEETCFSKVIEVIMYFNYHFFLSLRGELCVIDWKTSTKPKPHLKDLHDYPLQAVAYAGAINNDTTFNFKVSSLILLLYNYN